MNDIPGHSRLSLEKQWNSSGQRSRLSSRMDCLFNGNLTRKLLSVHIGNKGYLTTVFCVSKLTPSRFALCDGLQVKWEHLSENNLRSRENKRDIGYLKSFACPSWLLQQWYIYIYILVCMLYSIQWVYCTTWPAVARAGETSTYSRQIVYIPANWNHINNCFG